MDIKLAIDCFIFFLTLAVAIYAIRDSRKQIHEMILLERNRAYLKVRTDMMWLYLDRTEESHTPEIAKGLEEFCITAQSLKPEWTVADLKDAVENESLSGAKLLVTSGHATWKREVKLAEVEKKLLLWQSHKNRERIHQLFGMKKMFLF